MDAVVIRVICEQVFDHFARLGAWPQAVTILNESALEPSPLGVGDLFEAAEVHRHCLRFTEELRQLQRAEAGIGRARGRGALQMADETVEGRPSTFERSLACRVRLETLSEPLHRGQQTGGDRCRHRVERLDRRLDRLGPLSDVSCLGRRSLLARGVLAVITGEVQVGEVNERVPAVDLSGGKAGTYARLDSRQLALIVSVRFGSADTDLSKQGGDASWRKVLDLAVKLMKAGILADLGHLQLPDGSQSVGNHGLRRYPQPAPPGRLAWRA